MRGLIRVTSLACTRRQRPQSGGPRSGKAASGQSCIDKVIRKGLLLPEAGRLPSGSEIRPVGDLLAWLIGGMPVAANLETPTA